MTYKQINKEWHIASFGRSRITYRACASTKRVLMVKKTAINPYPFAVVLVAVGSVSA